ncbi:MAG TPA: hypothetical protein VGO53_01905, partial [Steroidobacteraceae bacterium]|nr:hypothetical protein [Steroidobacteraceae bacterium]
GAGFLAPRLLDCGFGGVSVRALEETLVARTASNAAGVGDLLVLASNPAKVFVYSAASVQEVAKGAKPVKPTRTLLSSAQFPKGASLESMDFWPADNDLLIATSDGTILRYSFDAVSAKREPDFASGFGKGEFKLKTGLDAGTPYAVVTDNAGSRILEFGAPLTDAANVGQAAESYETAESYERSQTAGYGHEPSHSHPAVNPPLAIITKGVHKPLGLVTTNLAATSAGTCLESAGGCDLLGGLITHDISGLSSSSGYVIEDTCVVQVDPRITQYGSCTGHQLPVAQVCAGYGKAIIPDTLCGGSGASGSGFALVRSLTNSLDKAKGALVFNEVFSEQVLPGDNPPCPKSVFAWAPLEGEGTIVEGDELLELTGTCGSSGGVSRGLSLWGIGLVLNEAALPGRNAAEARVKFAAAKYEALDSTVSLASITSYFRKTLLSCICDSKNDFDRKKYSSAAAKLVECDSLVAANEGRFKASANNANPSGDIRGRFANLYLAINTRVLGNPPLAAWPPARTCDHHSKSALASTESHKGCQH